MITIDPIWSIILANPLLLAREPAWPMVSTVHRSCSFTSVWRKLNVGCSLKERTDSGPAPASVFPLAILPRSDGLETRLDHWLPGTWAMLHAGSRTQELDCAQGTAALQPCGIARRSLASSAPAGPQLTWMAAIQCLQRKSFQQWPGQCTNFIEGCPSLSWDLLDLLCTCRQCQCPSMWINFFLL